MHENCSKSCSSILTFVSQYLYSTSKCYFFAGRRFFIRKIKIKMANRLKHVLSKVVKNQVLHHKTFQVMFYKQQRSFRITTVIFNILAFWMASLARSWHFKWIETLRFFFVCVWTYVSLVAICAVIWPCKGSAVKRRHLALTEMHRLYQSMTRGRLYRFFNGVVITKSSIAT